ncbi:hypothetical protein PG984_014841 [Apiospora sp. TS-2023a]
MLNFTLLSLVWGSLAPSFAAAQIGSVTPTSDSILSSSATARPSPSLGPSPSPSSSTGPLAAALADDPPDVHLRIPELHVGSIQLDVDELRTEINLAAKIAGVVEINAGVQIRMKKASVTVADVDAALNLEIRLDNLVTIVNRTFQSVDLNPLLVNVLNLTKAAPVTSAVVGSVDGLLGTITNERGATVKVMIDNLGHIVEEAEGEEGRPARIVGDYKRDMTDTGAQTSLEGGLTQRVYSYPPLKAMVNIVTNADGHVVQAVVLGKGGQSGGATP